MKFPVIVVKGKQEEKVLHQIDLNGWLKAGWKIKVSEKEAEK